MDSFSDIINLNKYSHCNWKLYKIQQICHRELKKNSAIKGAITNVLIGSYAITSKAKSNGFKKKSSFYGQKKFQNTSILTIEPNSVASQSKVN